MNDDRVSQTGAYLRLLLLRPGPYRYTWERAALLVQRDRINNDAVARVLARYKEIQDPEGVIARHLTETVRRALTGKLLSAETLNLFIDAFEIGDRDAEHLWALMRGSAPGRVITGDLLPPPGVSERFERRHETLSLHELHQLGPDGMPAEHRTIQVIKSKVEGLESYPYLFDTDELAVWVERGGLPSGEIFRVSDSVFGLEIRLTKPLSFGETALMEYRTIFAYSSPPPPEFRRAVTHTTQSATIRVTFHPDRIPTRVWWARWDQFDQTSIRDPQLVELDPELSAHCRIDAIERAIVGYYWEWKDSSATSASDATSTSSMPSAE